jgi:zinc protease
MLDRKTPPNIKNATDFDFILPDANNIVCANQVPIYYVNNGAQEVISIEWVFNAGTWFEDQTGIAQCVATLLKNGTTTKSALQINETIEFYGASVKCSAGADYAGVQLTCLSKYAQGLLPLVYELITEALFPQSEVDIFVKNSLQRLLISLKKSDFVANRKIDEYLFGYAHPYGRYNNAEQLQALTSDKLKAFLKNYYTSNTCKIFVAGKYDTAVLTDLEKIFGSASFGNTQFASNTEHAIIAASEKKYRITNDEKGVQGSVRIASHFIDKRHIDFAPMILVNTLFGGYFGSRLMTNIREEKGYTYGIYSYIYNNAFDTAFAITTEAGKEVCEATVAEVYKEMDIMRKELVSADELQLVKNYLLGGLLGNLDGPFQIIARWKNLILFGFTKERFDNNIKIYKNITPEQILELSNKYLQPELFYELIVV